MLKNLSSKTYAINFGPQHPAAHGVLRLVLLANGEVILSADPHIGLLHRGTEKLIEYSSPSQGLPYMDRLDYVSMMAQEHCYALAFENALGIGITSLTSWIRVMCLEVTRILNHLMSLTTHAMDVGALTPFLWAFEEREKLMQFYEQLSGARMHANYIQIGGLNQHVPYSVLSFLQQFVLQFSSRIDEIEDMLTSNRIWCNRLQGVGVVTLQKALSWGFSGPMLRGSGLAWDLRKTRPYETYQDCSFGIPVGLGGDCYDRYLVRIQEMRESLRLICQSLEFVGTNYTQPISVTTNNRLSIKRSMEALISHFKTVSDETTLLPDTAVSSYIGVEAPKGEFGIYLEAKDGTINRLRIRAPGFFHLQGLKFMAVEHLLADTVTIIGTQDIVFGEVDR